MEEQVVVRELSGWLKRCEGECEVSDMMNACQIPPRLRTIRRHRLQFAFSPHKDMNLPSDLTLLRASLKSNFWPRERQRERYIRRGTLKSS